MYRVEINLGGLFSDDKVIIETSDFEKVAILQEFIELQDENGWEMDYEILIDEEALDDDEIIWEDEEEEDEEEDKDAE
jgi:hypothetical protein